MTHFIYYNDTVGPDVDKVLRKYSDRGEVTVLRWNLPLKTQKEIRTEGMFTALNECNLRLINRWGEKQADRNLTHVFKILM